MEAPPFQKKCGVSHSGVVILHHTLEPLDCVHVGGHMVPQTRTTNRSSYTCVPLWGFRPRNWFIHLISMGGYTTHPTAPMQKQIILHGMLNYTTWHAQEVSRPSTVVAIAAKKRLLFETIMFYGDALFQHFPLLAVAIGPLGGA